MTKWTIAIEGDEALARALAVDLDGPLQAATLALAAEAQNRIAPYPPAPPIAGRKRWYERGFGPRWRRRDGSVGGERTSEMMNRRWEIQPWQSRGAILRNTASYAGRVQSGQGQEPLFKAIGWKTDVGIADELERDGTAAQIAEQALRGAVKELE